MWKKTGKMNPVNMVAYRGNEVNLGGAMCVQQAESMHPFENSCRKKCNQQLEEQGMLRRGTGEPKH